MKRILYYYIIFTFILFGLVCISLYPFSYLSIFILGGWNISSTITTGNTTRELQNQYLFLPFHILLIKVDAPTGEEYKDIFSYKFISPDKVMVKGRLIDEFQVVKDGKDMTINSIGGFPSDGKYSRFMSFWGISGLMSLIWIVPPILVWVVKGSRSKNTS